MISNSAPHLLHVTNLPSFGFTPTYILLPHCEHTADCINTSCSEKYYVFQGVLAGICQSAVNLTVKKTRPGKM